MKISVVYEPTNRVEDFELPNDDMSILDLKEILNASFGFNIDNTFYFCVDGKIQRFDELTKSDGNVKALGLTNGGILVVTSGNSAFSAVTRSLGITSDRVVNLIKSIKIRHRNAQEFLNYIVVQKEGYKEYQKLKNSSTNYVLHQLAETMPSLSKFYENNPNDLGGFLILFTKLVERRRETMKPLTEEEKVILENQREAIEENPEILLIVNMLYFRCKVNDVECTVFVDTGAQQSLISPECVRKCNIQHLLDRSSARVFSGIGGTQQSEGRIWKVDMEVGGHDVPITLNVLNSPHEILLGLDIMLRHRAVIDLANRTITFAGSAIGHLLSDEESGNIRTSELMQNDEAMDTSHFES